MKNTTSNSLGHGISLNFKNPLAKEQQLEIKKRLEEIQEKLPPQTSIHFNLQRVKNTYKGSIKVQALYTSFFVVGQGTSALLAFSIMEEKLNRQILEWKKQRFLQKSKEKERRLRDSLTLRMKRRFA